MKFLKRWVFFGFLFMIAGGLSLHLKLHVPWISDWVGSLPGDIIVMKGRSKIYFPAASGLSMGAALALLLKLLRI
jgi:hypothetical protein